MEVFKVLMLTLLLLVLILGIAFLINAGLWWIVLWSFGFPIAFAWKQVIGITAISVFIAMSAKTDINI
jgi:hypothetical protein